MAKLFISYRREDSAHQADRLYEQLSKHVEDPRRDIFLDVDSIPFGVDFVTYLDGKVAECEVLLALIGKGWLAASDPKTGGRRLDDPKDFVRIEIASALKRGIPVVPVLLDGVPVPGAGDLPDDLKPLARRNGIVVTRRSFEGDVTALVRGLPTQLTARSGKDSEGRTALLVVGALLAAGLMAFAVHLILGIESKPGGVDQVFSDALFGGGQGPEMVVIPAGSFSMGSSPDERGRGADESPQHTVRIGSAFAVGKYEVTWAEWQACVDDGGCSNSGPDSRGGDEGWGKGSRPVINVSWENAQDYVSWLSRETGETYRLLTEAEWEYTLRRGTTGQFNYAGGERQLCDIANGADKSTNIEHRNRACSDGFGEMTAPVGSFYANASGLYDMHGNVWEWVEDCYQDSYDGAPVDGSARQVSNCSYRVLRGGAWNGGPNLGRWALRYWRSSNEGDNHIGFRVARTL